MQGARGPARVGPPRRLVSGQRRRGIWSAAAALAFGAAACSGAGAGSTAARVASTSTTASTTTTTSAASLPCGGSPTVAPAVRASPVAGLDLNPTVYQVEDVTTAQSDATWGRFDTLPQAGQEGTYQGGSGLVHCAGGVWTVTDFGTSEVGCPGGAAAPPPAAVAADLGIDCP
ncbi:MAG TPA: hypothetical protein VGU73_07970 [Acidimicrobiia bacterium]|nr:hypothetical protein [Acidimicrobiia bacterium]